MRKNETARTGWALVFENEKWFPEFVGTDPSEWIPNRKVIPLRGALTPAEAQAHADKANA